MSRFSREIVPAGIGVLVDDMDEVKSINGEMYIELNQYISLQFENRKLLEENRILREGLVKIEYETGDSDVELLATETLTKADEVGKGEG